MFELPDLIPSTLKDIEAQSENVVWTLKFDKFKVSETYDWKEEKVEQHMFVVSNSKVIPEVDEQVD